MQNLIHLQKNKLSAQSSGLTWLFKTLFALLLALVINSNAYAQVQSHYTQNVTSSGFVWVINTVNCNAVNGEIDDDPNFTSINSSGIWSYTNQVVFSFNSFSPGTRYYCRVIYRLNIDFIYSSPITVITLLNPPTALPPINVTSNSFTAKWNYSTNANNYGLQVSTDPNFTTAVFNQDVGNTNSYTITGLKPCTKYYYKVYARNSLTNSLYGNVISSVFCYDMNVTSQTVGDNAFTINWEPPVGPTLDNYNITVSENSDLSNPLTDYNNKSIGNVNTYTVNQGIDMNTNYYYQISGQETGTVIAKSPIKNIYTKTYETAGNALKFDGTDDYVALPAINLNSSNFTIEGWVKWDAFNNQSRIFDFGNGQSNNNIILFNSGTNQLDFQIYNGASGQALFVSNIIPTSEWVHIAAVASGGNMYLYMNGILIGTKTGVTIPNVNRTLCFMGKSNWAADAFFKGNMDEFRIWNVARSQKEIRRYMERELVGNEAGLLAYYKFNESTGTLADDITANNLNGTLTNGVSRVESGATLKPFPIKKTQMIRFDGVNDYVDVAPAGDDRINNVQTFSVAMWVNPAATQQAGASIVDATRTNTNTNNWTIKNVTATNDYNFATYENAAWNATTNFTLPANQWSFVVVTRDQTSKQKKVYVNGLLQGTKTGAADITFSNAGLTLGSAINNTNSSWKGSLDEFGFYSKVLSLPEIKALYMSHQQYDGNCQNIYLPFGEDAGKVTYDYSANDFPAIFANGVKSSTSTTPIDNGLAYPGVLKVSKGYYNTKVNLTWNVDKNWRNIINKWYVYRIESGSSEAPTLIFSSPTNENLVLYDDQTCAAGVLYEYSVIGETDFGGCMVYTNPVKGIGYRTPTGVVNGRITYEGGTAVKDVRVIATRSQGSVGNSLAFGGTSSMTIPHNEKLMPTTGISCEVYVRPSSLTSDFEILKKENSYGMNYTATGKKLNFWIKTKDGTVYNLEKENVLAVDSFMQITGSYNGNKLKLFVNGFPSGSLDVTGSLLTSTTDLVIGTNFNGNLDELRLWNYGKDSVEVNRDYFRILTGGEAGIVGYWRMDEGISQMTFDQSKSGITFFGNDGVLNKTSWSTKIPTNEQLGLCGITNANGDYSIANIAYNGAGETFNLTPFLNIHKFDPVQSGVYIGDGSTVVNGQNFKDISAFKVTGTVKYKDCDCYAKDVFVLIDDQYAVKGGKAVMTDANGRFEVNVPIGYHKLSIQKSGHVFENSVFPDENNLWLYDKPISGIEFIDTTTVMVRGRVVGGTREATKKIGFNKSKNNIGQAEITFKSQQGNGCFTKAITTNATSGEYSIKMPPLIYTIDKLQIPSNLSINFGQLDVLDLTFPSPTLPVIDTTFYPNSTKIKDIDTLYYQKLNNYVFRAAPNVSATNMDGTALSGESEIEYADPITKQKTIIDLVAGPGFGLPVYRTALKYKAKINVFEPYSNKDADYEDDGNINQTQEWISDLVPVNDGEIIIDNDLAMKSRVEDVLKGGQYIYSFQGGLPNVLADAQYPERSFTKTMFINVKAGSNTVTWPSQTTPYRAFVLGQKPKGNNFVTKGPQTVDFVLRDPPGSNSYATLLKGSSKVTNETWHAGFAADGAFEWSVAAGASFAVGFGLTVNTEIEAGIKMGIGLETSFDHSESLIKTTTINEEWSTSAESDFVGANGDIYVGNSQNLDYGLTDNLCVVDEKYCTLDGLPSYENSPITGLRLAVKPGLYVAPNGYGTTFMYTQNHIVNYLIPNLYMIRNNFFVSNPARYQSAVASDNANYGVKGYYTFNVPPRPTNPSDTYEHPLDSVAWYNNQIDIWKNTVARNEAAKVKAATKKNISFDAGTIYTYSEESTEENEWSNTFEFSPSWSVMSKIVAKVNGSGVELENHLKMTLNTGSSKSENNSKTFATSFTLNDANEGDYFSIDVKEGGAGNGVIFATRGGQSSCPYEDEEKTLFFNPGTTIGAATMRRDWPSVSVISSPIVNGVPENSAAEFTLSLGNESPTREDRWYRLQVVEESNPQGAVIEIDGSTPNRTFLVPAGSSIQKKMTVRKGSVNDYENLKIKIISGCDEMEDEVSFSVHYVPACSEVKISTPLDLFVVNSSNNNKCNIVISDYNVNYGGDNNGLQKIMLQYKPSTTSKWINLETFYKDTTGMKNPNLKVIPTVQPYIQYEWNVDQIIDGNYNLRAITVCPLAESSSPVISGIFDRVNPHAFGSPQPADGILSPGDEISLTFNETIQAGMLTPSSFELTGVLNGSTFDHNVSIYFDGISNYVRTPDVNLGNKSFSFDFWAKRTTNNQECFISQGTNATLGFWLGFDASNKFTASLAGTSIATTSAYTKDNAWHHYAFVYNKLTNLAALYIDGTKVKEATVNVDYAEAGSMYVGRRNFDSAIQFTGNMHELRVWNKPLIQTEIITNFYKNLIGNEVGLAYCWSMNEASGSYTNDKVRQRNAFVNAQWAVDPMGKSLAFNGTSQFAKAPGSTIVLNNEQNFSIEFWFKASTAQNACLLSNGKGLSDQSSTWSIQSTRAGKINVLNNDVVFAAVDTNYFDGSWHHFALVVNRVGNTLAFIDGKQQNSISNKQFKSFGGSNLWMGSRGWVEGINQHSDMYFNGKIDEVRIWNGARTLNQIARFKNNRLAGTEVGLMAYYPFESYSTVAGIPILTGSLNNIVNTTEVATVIGGATYNIDCPNIKLQQPISKVNYKYSVNNDKIILTITDPPAMIENCMLDIVAKNVNDLNGNVMQSPETWTAFIHMNQVRWQESELILKKKVYEPMTFTASVKNLGGSQEAFSIINLPAWLTASPQNGVIDALQTKIITFTINEGVNNGYYAQDIYLHTDFGFDDKLSINLRVYDTEPDWTVVPGNYQFSMNIIGQIKIDGIISNDVYDKVGAFVNGQCRGVGNLQYIKATDMYEVFLDVYSNNPLGEVINFKIWDASEGAIRTEVSPSPNFESDGILGTILQPLSIDASNARQQSIPLAIGWKWISLNLNTPILNNVNTALQSIQPQNGNIIRNQNSFAQYSSSASSWLGSLTELNNKSMYSIKLNALDTLTYSGNAVDVATTPLTINSGWNWIAFIPQSNMTVNESLSNLSSVRSGDIIKGQNSFAMYQEGMGWLGSLSNLTPGSGYMLKTLNSGSLVYPKASFGLSKISANKISASNTPVEWIANFNQFEHNMSVIAKAEMDNIGSVNQDMVLGAFVNNECRGFIRPVLNPLNKQNLFFINVMSNLSIGENVRFKLFDNSLNVMYDAKEIIPFRIDNVIGSINEPLALTFNNATSVNETLLGDKFSLKIFPVPFVNNTSINYNLADEAHVVISVYNLLGEKISTLLDTKQTKGNWEIEWKGTNASGNIINAGIYTIEIQAGDSKSIMKIVKINPVR